MSFHLDLHYVIKYARKNDMIVKIILMSGYLTV